MRNRLLLLAVALLAGCSSGGPPKPAAPEPAESEPTARLEFRIVSEQEDAERQRASELGTSYMGPPAGTEWVPSRGENVLDRLLEIPGDRECFTEADLERSGLKAERAPYGLGWTVSFAFKKDREKEFGDFTAKNMKRLMAIVIDGEVESAPIIQSRIPGRGMISGGGLGFSEKEAKDLVTALGGQVTPR